MYIDHFLQIGWVAVCPDRRLTLLFSDPYDSPVSSFYVCAVPMVYATWCERRIDAFRGTRVALTNAELAKRLEKTGLKSGDLKRAHVRLGAGWPRSNERENVYKDRVQNY